MPSWIIRDGGQDVPPEMQSTDGGEFAPIAKWWSNNELARQRAMQGKINIDYEMQGHYVASKIASYNAPIPLEHIGGGVYRGYGSAQAIRNLQDNFGEVQEKVVNMQPVQRVDLEVNGNEIKITLEFDK